MLSVRKIYPLGFASNCYLVTADGKTAVAIDPSQRRVLDKAKEAGLQIVAVLLTHGHFDHVGGCFDLDAAGVPIYCAAAEEPLVHGRDSMYREYGAPMPTFKTFSTLKDGDKISLAGIDFSVISTPGHTAGSITYLAEKYLFTGDTLFEMSVGRTDLPTGDWQTLVKSVRKLYALAGDYTVCPGHGDDTSLQKERDGNPYVRP